MSRHRAVRNLNLEEELYDEEDDSAIYDELQDISEDNQARLIKGVEAVRLAIGPDTGIEDREIKESLWYYFFDEEATIAWLQKTHKLKLKNTGNDHRSLDQIISAAPHRSSQLRLLRQPSPTRTSLNQALGEPKYGGANLSLKSLASSSGVPGLAKLSLGSLGQRGALSSLAKTGQPSGATTMSPSVIGKALAALKARPPSESLAAQSDSAKPHSAAPQGLFFKQTGQTSAVPMLKNFAGRQLPALKSITLGDRMDHTDAKQPERRRAALGADSLVLSSTTLYAGPSPLASFILNGLYSDNKGHAWELSRGTVVAALERDIRGVLEANKGEDDVKVTSKGRSKESKKAGRPFAFDTPSPDDKVLAAQSRAVGSGNAAAVPSPKASKSKPKAKETSAPALAKGVARLKIGGDGDGDGDDDQIVSSGAESVEITPAVTPKRRIDVVAEYSAHQKNRETLNLVVVGHVDAGKSTLMGHILYALGQVNERTMKKFERDAEKIGKGSFAFAWVLDETDEERSRGVTMDIATSAFSTQHRKFTLLDAPGHRDFVPNMISGASRADVAILVVDASTGGFESGFDGNGQTREHAILIRSLGVRQLVVAVNKLDVIEWSETRYLEITNRLLDFLTGCGYLKDDVRFAPVSGLKGVNLVHRIAADGIPGLSSWYHDKDDPSEPGPCLVELIDTFTIPERPVSKPFRLAVTDFFKGGTFSSANSVSVTGRISQGNIQIGEHVVLVPGSKHGVVKAIDVDFVSEEWAVAGDSVVLMIQGLDIQHISVGSVVCTPERPIQCTTRFEAQLVVFDPPVPITNGFPGLLHIQSFNVPAVVSRIIETFDQRSGEVLKRRPRHIRKGATARVEIVAETPVCLELFKDSKELGRVMLRKNGETIAAGIVTAIFGS
ncbi:hypothetical protein IWW37_005521 [Coemansia sp. RSA 2050]|nr:hypothetical protein IWW37_005521 [Coemansia sp. RSA 2050]